MADEDGKLVQELRYDEEDFDRSDFKGRTVSDILYEEVEAIEETHSTNANTKHSTEDTDTDSDNLTSIIIRGLICLVGVVLVIGTIIVVGSRIPQSKHKDKPVGNFFGLYVHHERSIYG